MLAYVVWMIKESYQMPYVNNKENLSYVMWIV